MNTVSLSQYTARKLTGLLRHISNAYAHYLAKQAYELVVWSGKSIISDAIDRWQRRRTQCTDAEGDYLEHAMNNPIYTTLALNAAYDTAPHDAMQARCLGYYAFATSLLFVHVYSSCPCVTGTYCIKTHNHILIL